MEALFALASSQYGLFTRRQANNCGVSDRALRYRVATGLVQKLNARVFRVRAVPRSWHQAILGACLGAPGLCVASHRTAKALHETSRFDSAIVEVTVPHGHRYAWPGAIVHQTRRLEAIDCCVVDGIPATTVARTLIDLGAVCHYQTVEDALDVAEREHRVKRELLERRFDALAVSGRNGIGAMRIVLDHRGMVVPESVLERRFLRLLENASIPLPIMQFQVRLSSGRVARIDAAYPERQLGYELDGHLWHASRSARAADNRRLDALANLGWDIRRFTYEQVVNDGPNVVRAVRVALGKPHFGAAG